MTQEEANKIFSTPLGQQLMSFYCTSDDRVFVRRFGGQSKLRLT